MESRFIALSSSDAPGAFVRWSFRILADKSLELEFEEKSSRCFKKTN
ncbi:MAG: hypothetical protein LBL90_08480 [Prevotellaceae bacterium]|jgi:hypothetical protein|nr:hypothetical protein [Prevotellaceae bacterium]